MLVKIVKLNQEFVSQGDVTFKYFLNILKFVVVETYFFSSPPIATSFPHAKSTKFQYYLKTATEKNIQF